MSSRDDYETIRRDSQGEVRRRWQPVTSVGNLDILRDTSDKRGHWAKFSKSTRRSDGSVRGSGERPTSSRSLPRKRTSTSFAGLGTEQYGLPDARQTQTNLDDAVPVTTVDSGQTRSPLASGGSLHRSLSQASRRSGRSRNGTIPVIVEEPEEEAPPDGEDPPKEGEQETTDGDKIGDHKGEKVVIVPYEVGKSCLL